MCAALVNYRQFCPEWERECANTEWPNWPCGGTGPIRLSSDICLPYCFTAAAAAQSLRLTRLKSWARPEYYYKNAAGRERERERENQHEPSFFRVLNGGKQRLPIKLWLPTLQRRQSSVSVGLAAAIWLYWAQLVGSSLCLALPISDAVASSAITRNIAAHCTLWLMSSLAFFLSLLFGLLKSIIYVDDYLPALLPPSETRMLSMSCDGAAAAEVSQSVLSSFFAVCTVLPTRAQLAEQVQCLIAKLAIHFLVGVVVFSLLSFTPLFFAAS